MYPTNMKERQFPDTNYMGKGTINTQRFGYGEFLVYIPENTAIPPLPIKHDDKLMFPTGYVRGWWIYDEVRMAVKYGAKIIEQYSGYGTDMSCTPFISFIQKCEENRAAAQTEQDAFGDLFWKSFANTFYGKFCQSAAGSELVAEMPGNMKGKKLARKLFNFYVIEDTEETPAKTSNFLWGAYITAYSRMFLYEGMIKVQQAGHEILYCDTDSIFFLKGSGENPLPIGRRMGLWSEDSFIDSDINTVKAYQLTCRDRWEINLSNGEKYVGCGQTAKEAIKSSLAEIKRLHGPKVKPVAPETVKRAKKIACKGVPTVAKMDFLNHGEATFKKPVKLKESFIRNLNQNVWRDVSKKQRTIYSKREILDGGKTRAFVFNMR
jgi:hypothetical protein